MNKLPRMALYFTSSTKQIHKAGASSVEATAKEPIGQADKVASHTHLPLQPSISECGQDCPGWRVELFVRPPTPWIASTHSSHPPIGKN
jgi:hypothetical protein